MTTSDGAPAAGQALEPKEAPAPSPYLTPESKDKGDAGIYAALDAMNLARSLHGATSSRLGQAEASPVAVGEASGNAKVRIGVEPVNYKHGASDEVQKMYGSAVVKAMERVGGGAEAQAVERGIGGASATPTAVGLPEDLEGIRAVLPFVHELKPQGPLNFDALQRLFTLMEDAARTATASGSGDGITSLLLAHDVINPARQPLPSTSAWEAKYREVQSHYPLPVPHQASSSAGQGDSDDEGDDAQVDVDTQNSVELQERCAKLNIPYENYTNAVRDLAFYEMRVLPLLCTYLSQLNEPTAGGRDPATVAAVACSHVKVLDLSYNNLGAPMTLATTAAAEDSGEAEEAAARQLAPLRALAGMLDANESLRYLNLRGNALGSRGVGIIAKALTKNIGLCGIDLSTNALSTAVESDEVEDPLYEPEDPVFGETLEGLEGLAEMLKKNKFLRVLRLAENGLHSGEDLTGPPPPEEEEEADDVDVDGDDAAAEETKATGTTMAARPGLSFEAAQERWQGVPLWNLVSPLCRYHRLRAIDLSKNALGNAGVRILAVALSQNTSVEVLDLTDNAIGYAGLAHLARYVLRRGGAAAVAPSSSALHTLILRQNPLGCVGGAADAAAGIDPRRRRLTKRQLKRATAAVQSFASALEGPRGLRNLVLASTYLGPTFSSILLRSLAHAEELEELDFAYNNACGDNVVNFDSAASCALTAVLYPSHREGRPPRLRRLCFDGNNLTAAGVAALLPPEAGVALPPSLQELTLSRNNLGDALGSLSQLLAAGASSLTRLDISHNAIHSASMLLPGLAVAGALVELNASNNHLGQQEGLLRELTATQQEAEVAQLFHTLAQLPELAVLDLSYNDWRAAHVEQLSAFFANAAYATKLRKLDVRHTPRVPTAQLMTLLQYVASRPTMEVFMATMVPERGSPADTAAPTASWTCDAILQIIHGVATNSASLREIDCGLLCSDAGEALGQGGSAVAPGSPPGTTAAMLNEAQERLLLNALLHSATGNP